MDETIDIGKYRKLSFLGIAILLASLGFAFFNKPSPLFHLGCLVFAIIGWLLFSHFHTKIAIHKLRSITDDYVKSAGR